MTTERDLIQRLADDLEGITEELVIPEYAHTEKERTDASLALVAEARALLDQPEPEGPTDEELLRCYGLAKRDHCYEGPIDDWPKRAERAATVCGLRAVIAADRARWGRPVTTQEAS